MKKILKIFFLLFLILTAVITIKYVKFDQLTKQTEFFAKYPSKSYDSVKSVPEFDENIFVIINNNKPDFNITQLNTDTFSEYSPLDDKMRVGVAIVCIGKETLPTEKRGSIANIYPMGWHLIKNATVNNEKLFNRCHLIAYQLSGENSIVNIMLGTKYFNNTGMLPFENLVAEYVKSTENHVLYRATPVFDGDNLFADGIQLEAMSIEDNGKGICFNVFIYNAQPGVEFNYETGEITYLD